jgi:hypothetical protein
VFERPKGAKVLLNLQISALTVCFHPAKAQLHASYQCLDAVLLVAACAAGAAVVAGLLLMYLPERHAFGGLVVLMQDRGLRRYYSTDMSLLQVLSCPQLLQSRFETLCSTGLICDVVFKDLGCRQWM